MLILPLPARPDWARPPIVTLALMLLCLIAFFMQGGDPQRYEKALHFYQASSLSELELAAYQADLTRRWQNDKADALRQHRGKRGFSALQTMESDHDFIERLRSNRVITPEHPGFARWRSDRDHFEALRARVVTENYALNGHHPTLATLFSHMFLHGDILHLSGNLAVLFVVGYTVEAALGPWGFLGLYLLGGLGSTLPDILWPSQSYALSLGASGAISAIMAAYLVLFGRRRINFFYWLLFFFGTARWPALAILPIWLANELLQKFVFSPNSNVNYLAHFAGLLSGALLVAAWRWKRQGRSAETVHRQDHEAAVTATRQQAERLIAKLQFGPAALQYRKLFTELQAGNTALAEEYLRIARLACQPELEADAQRHLLREAANNTRSITPARLAEALDCPPGNTPRLSPRQWENLLARLIEGRELDAAERLLLRLLPHPETRPLMLRQTGRLANAFISDGQTERAAPLQRLLASSRPSS